MAPDERDVSAPDTCQRCGSDRDLVEDRDIPGQFLCPSCAEALERQERLMSEWGSGEAPDELG